MLKRVFAWILIVGFVLLLLNIMLFQFYLIPSVSVYLVIAIWFVFANKPVNGTSKDKIIEQGDDGDE